MNGELKPLTDEQLYDVFSLCDVNIQRDICDDVAQYAGDPDPLVSAIRAWQMRQQSFVGIFVPQVKKRRGGHVVGFVA